MKKRYELQVLTDDGTWQQSEFDDESPSLKHKQDYVDIPPLPDTDYRVVQKLGRKVIKVIYPKGK